MYFYNIFKMHFHLEIVMERIVNSIPSMSKNAVCVLSYKGTQSPLQTAELKWEVCVHYSSMSWQELFLVYWFDGTGFRARSFDYGSRLDCAIGAFSPILIIDLNCEIYEGEMAEWIIYWKFLYFNFDEFMLQCCSVNFDMKTLKKYN